MCSPIYVDVMLAVGPLEDGCYGLLWWRTPQWTHFDVDPASFAMLGSRGVPEATVRKLQTALKDAHYDSPAALQSGMATALGSDARSIIADQLISRGIGPYRLFKVSEGPVVAYSGNGDGGQYVVVVPAAGLVAVRQIDANGDEENPGDDYDDFVERVIALAEATGRLASGP